MISRLLNKFAMWALSKNAPGGYTGEDDTRWAYTIESGGQKYLTRILFPKMFGVRVYLHHFHMPDQGHPHNHPWAWAKSLILTGSYDQELRVRHQNPDDVVAVTERHRWFNALTRYDYHRVLKLHGDVWTLFVTGPDVQDWGFLVDGIHVPWREHLKGTR